MLAQKFAFDEYQLSNGYMARVGGVELLELNKLELMFLNAIGWDVFVDGELYNRYSNALEIYSNAPNISPDHYNATSACTDV